MFEEVIKSLPFEVNPKTLSLSMEDTNIDCIKKKLFQLDKLSDEDVYNLVR